MQVTQTIKSLLQDNRLYLRVRYHRFIQALWLLWRSDVRKETKAKRAFYKAILPDNCKLIFDIGANEGILTNIFYRHSEKVIAVEPSLRNRSILSAKFSGKKHVNIIPQAVSNASGYQPWFEDRNDYAMGTLSRKWHHTKPAAESPISQIETVTLDELINRFGVPDYIKIDVEGHEQQVLEGLSQPGFLLSFEAILPQFLTETMICIHRLISINPDVTFNYSIDDGFAYSTYQPPDILINDLKNVQHTVDIFCKL